jgi:hypothetical protein
LTEMNKKQSILKTLPFQFFSYFYPFKKIGNLEIKSSKI